MADVTRHNHFVPRFYLRQWSDDDKSIWSYRLLVEHENVPPWSRVAVRGLAAHEDLYTQVVGGAEIDEFERWVKSEFEDPAVSVFEKLAHDADLVDDDWRRLARFFAAQDVRTPTTLLESLRRWQKELPSLLEDSMRESIKSLETGESRLQEDASRPGMESLRSVFRVTVDREAPAPPGMVQIRAEVTPGRSMWVSSIELLLTGAAETLTGHKWTLAEAHKGWHWMTSDHPVMRLNYNGTGDYSFTGGWGYPGTDLIMPLSPRYLMFCQVGKDHGRRIQFSLSKTVEIQRLICERAHREVFACRPIQRVTWFRPRTVDAVMVKQEKEEWARWHEQQATVERAQDDREESN